MSGSIDRIRELYRQIQQAEDDLSLAMVEDLPIGSKVVFIERGGSSLSLGILRDGKEEWIDLDMIVGVG